MKTKEIAEIIKSCETNFFHEDSLVGEIVDFSDLEYKTAKAFNRKTKNHKKRLKGISEKLFDYLQSQYMAFEIFKRGGLLKKCLRKIDLDYRQDEELDFVKYSAKNPWRFSYCEIIDNPAEDIYIMRDCFLYEEFTLYSKDVTKLQEMEEHFILTWFLLIYHNGKCYQAYGPPTYFNGILADDIYFFASEKNPAITSEKELMADLNRDPIPYMMLVSTGRIPLIVSQGHAVKFFFAAIDAPLPHFKLLQKEIDLDHKRGLYRMGLKNYAMSPHFSRAYYDPKKRELQLHALTEEGFEALAHIFKKQNLATEILPDIIVSPVMINAIANVLDKKVKIDHYEHLFKSKIKLPEEDSEMDRINHFLTILTDKLNNQKEPDIIALAKESYLSLSSARSIYESYKSKKLEGADHLFEDKKELVRKYELFLDLLMEDLQIGAKPDINILAESVGIPEEVGLDLFQRFRDLSPKIFNIVAVSVSQQKGTEEKDAVNYFFSLLARELWNSEKTNLRTLAKEAEISVYKAIDLYNQATDTVLEKFKTIFRGKGKPHIGSYRAENINLFLDRYFEEYMKTKEPDILKLAEEAELPLTTARDLIEFLVDVDTKSFKDLYEQELPDSDEDEEDEESLEVEIFRELLSEELRQTDDPDIEKLAKKAEISVDHAMQLYNETINKNARIASALVFEKIKPFIGPHNPKKVFKYLVLLFEENRKNQTADIEKIAKEAGVPLTMAHNILEKLNDIGPVGLRDFLEEDLPESQEEEEELEKLRNENKFLKLLKEKLEQGEVPNYGNLAKEAGIPMETVNEYKRNSAVAQTIKNLLKK